jgi:hypothetical protein
MSEALFLRLLPYDDKSATLTDSIKAAGEGCTLNTVVHIVNPTSFSQIPGSTFAYWVSNKVLRLFTKLPKFESEKRSIHVGLQTSDDFRFVRLWWEVSPQTTSMSTRETISEKYRQQTFQGKYWIPLAKGGTYSPYYSDIHLVVNWERNGEEIRNFDRAFIRNENLYFHPGLTWPARTTSGISIRILPKGCIFSHKGPAVFAKKDEREALLALMNSQVFEALVALQLGAADAAARSYEVGLIQKVPVPDLFNSNGVRLGELAIESVNLNRNLDIANETTHIFHLPALFQLKKNTLGEDVFDWQVQVTKAQQLLTEYQHEIDDIVFQLYGITGEDRQAIEESLKSGKQVGAGEIVDEEVELEDDDSAAKASTDTRSLVVDLLSYIIGCTFGRWDIRFATGEQSVPELPGPFVPLPACSPGMLIGSSELPLQETPLGYPLDINWEGILVDDADHLDDIVRHLQDVLKVIWQERAESIEEEACQLLGIKELREYFRKPGNGGFWIDHVRRYSKSRRKAPIYWLLQSSKRNYALWLYYHRLDKDTLFKALTKYVEPKIRLEDSRLEQWRAQLVTAGSEGREVKQLERQLERQDSLVTELYDFRDKLRRAADLNLEPDLNDGVVLNIAPLRELVLWSEAKKYWDELLAGKYEWSSISKQLRSKGVI